MFQIEVHRKYNEYTEHEVNTTEFFDYRDFRDALEFFLKFGDSEGFQNGEIYWFWWENDNEISYTITPPGAPGGNCGRVTLIKWPGFEKDVKVRYEEYGAAENGEFYTFGAMVDKFYGKDKLSREVTLCLDDFDGRGLAGGLRNSEDDFKKFIVHVSEAKNPIQLLNAMDRVMQEVSETEGTNVAEDVAPLPF